jgi:hypothetical protein
MSLLPVAARARNIGSTSARRSVNIAKPRSLLIFRMTTYQQINAMRPAKVDRARNEKRLTPNILYHPACATMCSGIIQYVY